MSYSQQPNMRHGELDCNWLPGHEEQDVQFDARCTGMVEERGKALSNRKRNPACSETWQRQAVEKRWRSHVEASGGWFEEGCGNWNKRVSPTDASYQWRCCRHSIGGGDGEERWKWEHDASSQYVGGAEICSVGGAVRWKDSTSRQGKKRKVACRQLWMWQKLSKSRPTSSNLAVDHEFGSRQDTAGAMLELAHHGR